MRVNQRDDPRNTGIPSVLPTLRIDNENTNGANGLAARYLTWWATGTHSMQQVQ